MDRLDDIRRHVNAWQLLGPGNPEDTQWAADTIHQLCDELAWHRLTRLGEIACTPPAETRARDRACTAAEQIVARCHEDGRRNPADIVAELDHFKLVAYHLRDLPDDQPVVRAEADVPVCQFCLEEIDHGTACPRCAQSVQDDLVRLAP